MDTVVAGNDPVAVDAVACRVIGLDPMRIRHLRTAYERRLGWMLPSEIEVVGRTIPSVLHPLKMEISGVPQTYGNLTFLEGKGCSGCPVTNRMALSFFSPDELNALGGVTLVVGERAVIDLPQGRCFFIGNCAIRANKGRKGTKISGCPPPGIWIRRGLTEAS